MNTVVKVLLLICGGLAIGDVSDMVAKGQMISCISLAYPKTGKLIYKDIENEANDLTNAKLVRLRNKIIIKISDTFTKLYSEVEESE